MPHGASDTDEATERIHLELLRNSPLGHRLRMAISLSDTVIGLSRGAIARAHPDLTPEELDIRFVAEHYGERLAGEFRDYLRRPPS